MIKRKYAGSKLFVLRQVAPGVSIFVPQTSDIPTERLQYEFEKALDRNDYEYAEALSAEAKSRNLHLKA